MINETKIFSFANFEVDADRRLLFKQGEAVSLNPKAFDLLLVLLENQGNLLTKNELLDKVWEGQFVEENNLTVHITALRKALGETKNEHRFIVTVPGKGYKFVAEVHLPNFVQSSQSLQVNHLIGSTIPADEFESNGLFIGRRREIEEIRNLLQQGDIKLVTLTGAGGMGKTSLARAVAAELKTYFPDGIFFVELAAATETNFVVSAIGQTLNLTESGSKSLTETIKEFLHERQILLILDNFEQILSVAPLVKELLATTLSLKILLTSRAPLRLKNEYEFLVKPLELPPSNAAFSLEKLAEYPAILLFCKRAQAVKPLFLLSNENIATVAKICQHLDGLPLAIELAAARIKLLAAQEILARLENSLNLLTGGANDSPERQRTMRETIRWSYDLLTKDEQILFRRLAVFAGSFLVNAAEAIAKKKENLQIGQHISAPPDVTLDLLSSLVDNNLLVPKDQTDGIVRLRMLEVVREFALEVLQMSGEIDDLQRIHARYFLSLAEEAEPFLQVETGNEWLEKLENEHDNFRVALSWSLKNDGEIAARIAAALRHFWQDHNHLSEGLGWSKAALQMTENTVSEARRKLLLSNGLFLKNNGNLEAAQKSYEKGLAESQAANDLQQLIIAQHGLAAITVLQKDFVAAQHFNEEALALSRELNDETQTAFSLCSLGDLEMSKGNLSSARPLLEECLTLSKNLGNKRLLTVTYFNLGTIDYLENLYESAAFNFAESLQIAEEMGNTTMILCALDGFAALAAKGGNPHQSAKLAGAAESLRESIGYKIEPAEEIFRENYLANVRANLDEKSFSALYSQGKALSSDEAIALVNSQSLERKKSPSEELTEIIIEQHKIERITIEDEIQIQENSPKLILAKQKLSQPWFVLLIVIVVVTAISFAYLFWKNTEDSKPKPLRFTKLTSSGKITNATMTRDGTYAIFSQTEKDGESLWLKHIATGSQNQLLNPQAVNFVGLTVSPDSNFIYATVFSGDLPDPQVWRIPLLGGANEHIKGVTTGAAVSLSPDGKRMAFTESRSSLKETHFSVADSNGANKKVLVRGKDDERSFPNFKASPVAWSADGNEIACIVEEKTADGGRKAAILLVNPNDGSEKLLTEKRWDYVENLTWFDAENLVLTASAMSQGQIWKVARQTGDAQRITNDLNSYSWTSVGNKNILTVQKNVVSRVSIIDFDETIKKLESREILEESGYIFNVNWTPNGKIIYSSTASGQPEIWRINADGTEHTQLTVNSGISFGISVLPLDDSLLFCSTRNGKHSLYLADSEGKNMRQIIEGTEDVFGTFTPDGQSIIFQRGLDNKTTTLWRFDLKDKNLTQLTQKHALHPTISPDGNKVAHYFMDADTDNLWRIKLISSATGESLGKINLPKEATERRMRWYPTGKFISQIAYQGEEIKMLFLPIDGGDSIETFDLGKGDLQWFEWSKDGKKIVVSHSTETQDIVLLSQ